jgi:hypothetical protein
VDQRGPFAPYNLGELLERARVVNGRGAARNERRDLHAGLHEAVSNVAHRITGDRDVPAAIAKADRQVVHVGRNASGDGLEDVQEAVAYGAPRATPRGDCEACTGGW